MRHFLPVTLTLLLIGSVRPVFGEPIDVHVSPTGKADAVGTAANPITLEAVLPVLEKHRRAGHDDDIRIVLAGGVYRIEKPIRLGPGHLPKGDGSLTFLSKPGAPATISGGRAITGWKKAGDGTFSTKLASVADGSWAFRELFVDGKRRPRARHPNSGYLRAVKSVPDKRTGFTFGEGDLPEGVGEGAEVVFLHDWSMSRVRLASVDVTKRLLRVSQNIGCAADHYRIDHFEAHPRYFVENHRRLLDAPGEWHLDAKTGVLTYKPMPGETPEKLRAVAPVATRLLHVAGGEAEPVRRIHFRGVRFEHCGWQLPKGGYASGQASVHEWRDGVHPISSRKMMESALVFERARGCSVVDCEVRQLGLSGLLFGADTHDCRVVGCLFEDISANSINVGEDNSRRVKGKTWWQSAPEQTASGHEIANNLIRTGGRQFFGSVAVWAGIARRVHIHHNEIRDHPYTGVSLGWMWNPTPTPAGGHVVEHNHIHHVMQTLSDGGGIYTLGRQPGTQLRANHIHHIPLNAGRAESNGMFLDQGSDSIRIAGNVIHTLDRSPLRFHQAKAIRVEKNVLVVPTAKTPAYRYNRTDPATVTRVGNEVVEAERFDVKSVRERVRTWGLPSAYRKRWGVE